MYIVGEPEEEYTGPSKSQLKREAEALVQLGKELIELGDGQLARIEMPAELRRAIHETRQIRHHSARKRQLKFIGRLLREADAEPIRQAVENLALHHRQETRQFHAIEQWRDRLLSEGDAALNELVAEKPELNVQQLRQLMRQAIREQQTGKPPKSARALFKLLREHLA